jgi:hypothetical protein
LLALQSDESRHRQRCRRHPGSDSAHRAPESTSRQAGALFVVRNAGPREPEDGKAPEHAETIDAAGGSEYREHDLQSVVTSWILGVSTRSAVTVASWLLIALAKP